MPYTMPRDIPFAKMRRLLLGYELNGTALADVLGCSQSTARARLERPETLTLADIDRINVKGHVPIDELRAAISK